MTNIDRAKSTLRHYLKTAFEAAGRKWDNDNNAEVDGIVDDLVAGIEERHEDREKDAEEIRSRIRDAREGRG